jgi:hypothetical protein
MFEGVYDVEGVSKMESLYEAIQSIDCELFSDLKLNLIFLMIM